MPAKEQNAAHAGFCQLSAEACSICGFNIRLGWRQKPFLCIKLTKEQWEVVLAVALAIHKQIFSSTWFFRSCKTRGGGNPAYFITGQPVFWAKDQEESFTGQSYGTVLLLECAFKECSALYHCCKMGRTIECSLAASTDCERWCPGDNVLCGSPSTSKPKHRWGAGRGKNRVGPGAGLGVLRVGKGVVIGGSGTTNVLSPLPGLSPPTCDHVDLHQQNCWRRPK